jgi:putative FmdB family regulatory protein
MSPLYDYECYSCGELERDVLEDADTSSYRQCAYCRGTARRIVSKITTLTSGDSNSELKASADVVDPTESPEAAEFVKHRTRGAQEAYMKRHDLRFLQDGEKPQRPEPVDIGKLAEKIVTKRRKDEAIKI